MRLAGVQVLVDVPLFHLDRPFTYRVPETLQGQVHLGSRVKVPFGGRRRVDGWVVGRAAELPADARDILRVVSPIPSFGPAELDLFRWVADRYAGAVTDTLRLAIPPRVAAVEASMEGPATDPPGAAPDPPGAAPDPPGAAPGPPVGEATPTPGAGGSAVHSPSGTVRVPLGRVFGARSGDKGGNANVGVWARDERAYRFLDGFLTLQRFRELIPEARELRVDRYALPNLLALNFVVVGLLGEGVSSSTRVDPQAKGLGEWLRARVVDLPVELLDSRGG